VLAAVHPRDMVHPSYSTNGSATPMRGKSPTKPRLQLGSTASYAVALPRISVAEPKRKRP